MVLCCFNNLCGQTRPIDGLFSVYKDKYPNIINPSPEAAEFQRFLGYPISHSNGLIDLKISLFELNTYNLTIPLQLSYNSSGIKMQETDGIVGLGWSLNPGFRISRTINGKPDEYCPVILLPNSNIETVLRAAVPIETHYEIGVNNPDGQYDIFNVDLPNIHVSFILDYRNGQYEPCLLTASPVEIKALMYPDSSSINHNRLYGFEVKDDKGNKYYMGELDPKIPISKNQPEYLEFSGVTINSMNLPMGWMLREIEHANNEKTTFKYTSKGNETKVPNFFRTIVDEGQSLCRLGRGFVHGIPCPDDYKIISGDGTSKLNIMNGDEIEKYSSSKVIESITSKNFKLVCGYSVKKRLQKITLYSSDGKEIKKVENNFTSEGFLSKLLINEIEKYEFEYNMFDEQFSKYAIDWWGYFNGAVKNANKDKIIANAIPACRLQEITNNKLNLGIFFDMGYADRDPDSTYMKAKSLKKITYPTGGTLTIDYESNRLTVDGQEKIGPGLRVKSTELYDPESKQVIKDEFSYEEPHYTGAVYPEAKYFISTTEIYGEMGDDAWGPEHYAKARNRTVSTFSPYPYISDDRCKIWYGKVTQKTGDNISVYQYISKQNLFETIYGITVPKIDSNSDNTGVYYPQEINQYLYPQPLLQKETKYKKKNDQYYPIEEITNNYEEFSTGDYEGEVLLPQKKVITKLLQHNDNLDFWRKSNDDTAERMYYLVDGPVIAYLYYKIRSGIVNLTSTEKKVYFENDTIPIIETTLYKYDKLRPYNLLEKRVNLSTDHILEKYYYVNNDILHRSTLTNVQQSVLENMKEQNLNTTLIQQTLEKNNNLLYSNLFGYKMLLNNLFVPETIYRMDSTNNYSPRIRYLSHDNHGNPTQIIKDNAFQTIYIWSYNYQYPVAEIQNATYAQVESAVAAIGLGTIDNLSQSFSPDKAKLDALRAQLPDALVTTYTYEPLVGMVSMTDPRGVTTYYEYDSSGRLKNMKDNNKHIVELYHYNYLEKEPIEPFSLKFSDIIYNNKGDYGKTLTANIYCKENVTILLTYDFKINSPHSGTNEQVSFSVGTFSEHLLEDSREEGVKIHLSAGNNKVYIEAYKGDRNKGSGSVSISIDKVISENADKWNISSPSSLTFSY